MRKINHAIIGSLVSVLFGYLAFRGVSLEGTLSVFSTVRLIYLLPATAILILAYVVRAIRWSYLVAPVKLIPIHSLFASTMIGFMANNVLPLRAGEIVRAYSIARTESLSVSSALGTLVLERLLDGIAISLLMVVLLPLSFPPWLVNLNYLLLLLYAGGIGVALLLLWRPARRRFQDSLLFYLPTGIRQRIKTVFRNFADGLEALRGGRQILWINLLTMIHWLIIVLYYFLLFQACDLRLTFLTATVLVVVLSIGIMLPAAPGYVGNFQYFTVVALSLFSIPKETALGFSLIAHVGQFIPVTAIGLLYFLRQNMVLSHRDFLRTSRDVGSFT